MTTIIMISQDSSVIIGPEDGTGGGGSPESKEETAAETKTSLGGAQGEQQIKGREQQPKKNKDERSKAKEDLHGPRTVPHSTLLMTMPLRGW